LDNEADLVDLAPLPDPPTPPSPSLATPRSARPPQPPYSGKRCRQFAQAYANIFRNGTFDERVEERAHLILSILTIILAALFIVGAMILLFFTENNNARLAIVCVLTVSLPVCLITLTDIKRQEVFIASATYVYALFIYIDKMS
jgi:hypothetical protein